MMMLPFCSHLGLALLFFSVCLSRDIESSSPQAVLAILFPPFPSTNCHLDSSSALFLPPCQMGLSCDEECWYQAHEDHIYALVPRRGKRMLRAPSPGLTGSPLGSTYSSAPFTLHLNARPEYRRLGRGFPPSRAQLEKPSSQHSQRHTLPLLKPTGTISYPCSDETVPGRHCDRSRPDCPFDGDVRVQSARPLPRSPGSSSRSGPAATRTDYGHPTPRTLLRSDALRTWSLQIFHHTISPCLAESRCLRKRYS